MHVLTCCYHQPLKGATHAEITDSGGRRRRIGSTIADKTVHEATTTAPKANGKAASGQGPASGAVLSALATMPPDALAKLTIEDLTLLYSAFEAAGAAFLSIYNVPACDAAPAAVSPSKDEMDRCDWTLEHIANDPREASAK
jgi:hypothetical protein